MKPSFPVNPSSEGTNMFSIYCIKIMTNYLIRVVVSNPEEYSEASITILIGVCKQGSTIFLKMQVEIS
jgi:hypothetical protein